MDIQTPWVKKYFPKRIMDIVGQDSAVNELHDFVIGIKKQRKKAMMIYGPTGCGKTSAVYALANDLNLELIEVNASDFRNEERINAVVGNALKQQSLFSKSKIVLVDEIDGLSGTKDRGGINALNKLIRKGSFPVIMTANNPFGQKFSALRSASTMVEFNELSHNDVYSILEKVCEKEGIKFEESALKNLARRCGGDLRGAVNDLQSLSSSKKQLTEEEMETLSDREKEESIPNALVKIFKAKEPKIAITAFDNVNEDYDKLMLWIDENLPEEYTDAEDLARAYDYLSKADVMNRRIRRWQHWRFLVYINAYLSAGVAVSKSEKQKGFVQYKPTTRILKLWKAKMKYMKRKAIAQKVAEKTHSSVKDAIKNTLPYLQVIFKHNREMGKGIGEFLDLDKEEMEWLGR